MRRTVVALLAAVSLLAACGGGDDDDSGAAEGPAVVDAEEGIDGVQAVRVEGGDHRNGTIDYDRRPPAGGDHNAVWANCGFYDQPIPDEHLVHDLEHGAVWLAYAPDLDEAAVATIRALTDGGEKVIAAPYERLDEGVAVVATAWARQLSLASVDDPRLERFIEQYQDGDQAPEAGVTCRESPLGQPRSPGS